jgi:hypothetical protein
MTNQIKHFRRKERRILFKTKTVTKITEFRTSARITVCKIKLKTLSVIIHFSIAILI